MRPLKTKEDCQKFIDKFGDGSIWIFNDSSISMFNHGITKLIRDGDSFYQFSFGVLWEDQQRSLIVSPIDFVWRHRKDIKTGEWLIHVKRRAAVL